MFTIDASAAGFAVGTLTLILVVVLVLGLADFSYKRRQVHRYHQVSPAPTKHFANHGRIGLTLKRKKAPDKPGAFSFTRYV